MIDFFNVLTGLNDNKTSEEIIILIPSIIFTTILIILFVLTLCAIKRRVCVAKKTLEEDHNQPPTYEEITQCHKDILMEENDAYGHITHASRRS